jgi:hypothetical protein
MSEDEVLRIDSHRRRYYAGALNVHHGDVAHDAGSRCDGCDMAAGISECVYFDAVDDSVPRSSTHVELDTRFEDTY